MRQPLGTHARKLPRYRNEPERPREPELPDEPVVYRTTAAGDTRKLRGIPAIGRGVTGAINTTSPHHFA